MATDLARKIYFAGAIRGGRENAELYLEIVSQLGTYGQVLTEHIGDPALTARGEETDDHKIHDRDLQWLAESDYLVAEVTTPSLGVGYEIGKATEWGKAVLCLFRTDRGSSLSAMIAGSNGVTVRDYETSSDLEHIFKEFFLSTAKA